MNNDEYRRFLVLRLHLSHVSPYRCHYSGGAYVLTDVREPLAGGTYYTLSSGQVGSDRRPIDIYFSLDQVAKAVLG